MEFAGKGRTLVALSNILKHSKILPLCLIKRADYINDNEKSIKILQNLFPNQNLIIRSSSQQEDIEQYSSAGKYTSVLNVNSNDSTLLKESIERVFASYKNDIMTEEVLVQPMLHNIFMSGVAFTCDINTSAPYYIINYSETTDTTLVTSGTTNKLKTFVAYKNGLSFISDQAMISLITSIQEIESVCENDHLDIEFAMTIENEIYILQVRPITNYNKKSVESLNLDIPLDKLYKKIEKLTRPHPFLLGHTTCFGLMPDWNPAEILGIRPKKLAVSLYKELITDNIWAHQRNNYGYRDLTLHPLMVSFCGIPYIDVRITFNSFIPKNLQKQVADKLADYYIQRLKNYPEYHDKVEFEIVYSCYYIGLPNRLKELLSYGFTENELKRIEFSLLELTNEIIHPQHGLYKKDMAKLDKLIENHNKIINSDISIIDKIYWLIEECKVYGTLPFAGIARAGFIAIQFLHSFVDSGIITDEDYNNFMSSLKTVNKELNIDWLLYQKGEMSNEDFLGKYGHIRPDTYNILSPRYDEAFASYFSETEHLSTETSDSFMFSDHQMERIQWELDQNGLLISSELLINFIKESIEGREYAKFVFTRSVSEILRLIKQLGERMSILAEDMQHLDISVIKQLYVDLYFDNLTNVLENNIIMNKKQYVCTNQLKLPSVICSAADVYSFYMLEGEPNFITSKKISGQIVCLENGNILETLLENKIIFISSADPGYDFLFTKNISGLVTEFGGANSHMAIRCAEMGIPAVIGAGGRNFAIWKQYKRITIDCLSHSVKPLNSLEAKNE